MNHAAMIKPWPTPSPAADTPPLWTAKEVAKATGGVASADFAVTGVAIDSREVQPGDLFIALKGAAMDGHDFVAAAFARGAAAALVEHVPAAPGAYVRVADSYAALVALGAAARARLSATAVVIGVTGSVGKTSVKEAIFAALDRPEAGAAHRSLKSYNNHVGVPLSLARMPANTRFGVFEMGMNHAGEIAALTAMVRPHVAVITAIGPAHIENLGSEDAIADAKAEIFLGLARRLGAPGVAIIPADSPHSARLAAAAEAVSATVVRFGTEADATVRLLDVVSATTGGSLITLAMQEGGAMHEKGAWHERYANADTRRLCYTVAASGEHWVHNSLAVMAAVRAAGGELGAAGLALAELPGLPGRGARASIAADDGGHATLIDESYNANPTAMRAALAVLRDAPARRRIAVLGAMRELGDFTAPFHAALAPLLRQAGVTLALLVGAEMAALADALGKADDESEGSTLGKRLAFAHCDSTATAGALLAEHGILGGDVILVKGSNSVGLGALVTMLAERSVKALGRPIAGPKPGDKQA